MLPITRATIETKTTIITTATPTTITQKPSTPTILRAMFPKPPSAGFDTRGVLLLREVSSLKWSPP